MDIDPDLEALMHQTAVAQIEIRRALAELSVGDLWKMKAQAVSEIADLDAEIRLLTKAIALKEACGDGP